MPKTQAAGANACRRFRQAASKPNARQFTSRQKSRTCRSPVACGKRRRLGTIPATPTQHLQQVDFTGASERARTRWQARVHRPRHVSCRRSRDDLRGDMVGIIQGAPAIFRHCALFPLANPDRLYRRVLYPGPECAKYDGRLSQQRKPICLDQFEPQVTGSAHMVFPIVQSVFRLWSDAGETFLDASALVIPKAAVNIACPPSTHVKVGLKQRSKPIRVRAFSANGTLAGEPRSAGLVRQL